MWDTAWTVTWDAGAVTRVWDTAWTVHLGRGRCDPSVGHAFLWCGRLPATPSVATVVLCRPCRTVGLPPATPFYI